MTEESGQEMRSGLLDTRPKVGLVILVIAAAILLLYMVGLSHVRQTADLVLIIVAIISVPAMVVCLLYSIPLSLAFHRYTHYALGRLPPAGAIPLPSPCVHPPASGHHVLAKQGVVIDKPVRLESCSLGRRRSGSHADAPFRLAPPPDVELPGHGTGCRAERVGTM
jgi:hypothetical protein